MEFQFEHGDDGIVAELAFAAYEDGTLCLSHAGHPFSVEDSARVLGSFINQTVPAYDENSSWISRRDEIHRYVRLFAEAMKAEPSAIVWHKLTAEDEPDVRHIWFATKGSRTTKRGIYDKDTKTYTADGKQYSADDVTYWCHPVRAPIATEDELEDFYFDDI